MREFLDLILPPHGLAELRAMRPPAKVEQEFYSISDSLDWMIESAHKWDADGYEVYFGALPRTVSRGKATDVWPTSDVLWADIDAKGRRKSDLLFDINDFPVPPNVVNDTGHGYHCWWKLDREVPFAQARAVMEGIARRLHGDPVYDQPRVMRLPGLSNHKSEVLPVRLLRFDSTRRHDLADFDEFRSRLVPSPILWRFPSAPNEMVPDWLHELMVSSPPKGIRSEAIFKVITSLMRLGWSDEGIHDHIWGNPIGEKARENGEHWLQQEIKRVRAKVA